MFKSHDLQISPSLENFSLYGYMQHQLKIILSALLYLAVLYEREVTSHWPSILIQMRERVGFFHPYQPGQDSHHYSVITSKYQLYFSWLPNGRMFDGHSQNHRQVKVEFLIAFVFNSSLLFLRLLRINKSFCVRMVFLEKHSSQSPII